MKKSDFKASHKKRKINANVDLKISMKKQKGYTERLKMYKIYFQK